MGRKSDPTSFAYATSEISAATSESPPTLNTPPVAVPNIDDVNSDLKGLPSLPYEVRSYEPYSVCSLAYEGGPKGFQALAGYIFGRNEEGEKMQMTTPVFMGREGGGRRMSFVMPSDYWGDEAKLRENAPTPIEGTGIVKVPVGGEVRAAMWYGGIGSQAAAEEKGDELFRAIGEDEEWRIVGGREGMMVANYNDPFTSPWKRRNEVQFKVERRGMS
ncbi:hypothetical protein TrRE_jg11459 [Triparma retinervis]|uniref:SOUL heme-binding protein n=1 Tax=Triparma retinervis TaxID=2557542 RepID=A0A9W6ZWV2_9STRA|nr:hypothetical protein TrRE_jg11459 [Triparma retinervis]